VRVLITGMGGELGTRVALLLEADRRVTQIVGTDVDPPRKRLRRAMFHRLDPRDRRKLVALVRDVAPTAVVHIGVYEPDARSSPRTAGERTASAALGVLGAAAETGELTRVVVRSGIEVYGRRRGCVTVPDEGVAPDPTSAFGRSLLETERLAVAAGQAADCAVTALRFGTIVGPHYPSPVGRYLRMPLVPFEALGDPSFSLLHQEDAARATVAALHASVHGPVNVVGPGATTAAQAARLGSRPAIPVAGPLWPLVRRLAELAGAPVPDHVVELLQRGRAADGTYARTALDFAPEHSTVEVVRMLYEWAPITPLHLVAEDAA
jgi:UDP-glucose 4-epimerase